MYTPVPVVRLGAASFPVRAWSLRCRAWSIDMFEPVASRVRTRGLLRTAPVSLLVAGLSLIATISVRWPSGLKHGADTVLLYRGRDLYHGALWRLPTSALLAQSWWQWASTALLAASLLAALEVRVGSGLFSACLLASHCAPTVLVAAAARSDHDTAMLSRADFGPSCLIVGAIAALAWASRSALLAVILALSLAIDPAFNSPMTITEHLLAAAFGILIVAALGTRAPSGSRLAAAAPNLDTTRTAADSPPTEQQTTHSRQATSLRHVEAQGRRVGTVIPEETRWQRA
jgi:membrane associated rhomboid family serine protease